MAYTQEELTALQSAIAQGVKKVKYSDKEVEYRDLNEMYEVLANMQKELGTSNHGRRYASHSKGIY